MEGLRYVPLCGTYRNHNSLPDVQIPGLQPRGLGLKHQLARFLSGYDHRQQHLAICVGDFDRHVAQVAGLVGYFDSGSVPFSAPGRLASQRAPVLKQVRSGTKVVITGTGV
jgi:hypothetical protein